MKIVGISGNKHFMLLWDLKGELYVWLENSSQSFDDFSEKNNILSTINLNNEKILMASCALNSCCALNEKGEIYYWNKYFFKSLINYITLILYNFK